MNNTIVTKYNVRINVIELVEFVFDMYDAVNISEGYASELLGLDRLDFRAQYRQWEMDYKTNTIKPATG